MKILVACEFSGVVGELSSVGRQQVATCCQVMMNPPFSFKDKQPIAT